MNISIKTLFFILFFLVSSQLFANNLQEANRLYDIRKYEEAMKYYLKADVIKEPNALNRIAFMYDEGLGVPKNRKIAFKWYKKAAEMGLAKAQFNLGLMYEEGEGTPKDIAEAVKWFRKAAEQKYPDAEMKMGYLSVTGTGKKKTLTKP